MAENRQTSVNVSPFFISIGSVDVLTVIISTFDSVMILLSLLLWRSIGLWPSFSNSSVSVSDSNPLRTNRLSISWSSITFRSIEIYNYSFKCACNDGFSIANFIISPTLVSSSELWLDKLRAKNFSTSLRSGNSMDDAISGMQDLSISKSNAGQKKNPRLECDERGNAKSYLTWFR